MFLEYFCGRPCLNSDKLASVFRHICTMHEFCSVKMDFVASSYMGDFFR